MAQHAVDDIILKNIKSVEYETHDNIDDGFGEDELYKLDAMILDEYK